MFQSSVEIGNLMADSLLGSSMGGAFVTHWNRYGVQKDVARKKLQSD
jgi:hypothetical protein